MEKMTQRTFYHEKPDRRPSLIYTPKSYRMLLYGYSRDNPYPVNTTLTARQCVKASLVVIAGYSLLNHF